MKICMVPGANLCCIRNALSRLATMDLPALSKAVSESRFVVDSILSGPPTPNGPPGIEKYRANRICLERVNQLFRSSAHTLDGDRKDSHDLQEVIRHTSKEALDMWEQL